MSIGRHRTIRSERQTKKDRIVYQNVVPVCPIVRTMAILNQKWPETVRSIAQREYFRMMCSSRLVLGHGAAIHVFHSRPTQKEDEKFPASFGTPRENLTCRPWHAAFSHRHRQCHCHRLLLNMCPKGGPEKASSFALSVFAAPVSSSSPHRKGCCCQRFRATTLQRCIVRDCWRLHTS